MQFRGGRAVVQLGYTRGVVGRTGAGTRTTPETREGQGSKLTARVATHAQAPPPLMRAVLLRGGLRVEAKSWPAEPPCLEARAHMALRGTAILEWALAACPGTES